MTLVVLAPSLPTKSPLPPRVALPCLLRRRGEDVCFYKESVEVVYTGDTLMKGLLSQPLVWKARLLIMEVTYLDGDRAVALKNFHIHVQVWKCCFDSLVV